MANLLRKEWGKDVRYQTYFEHFGVVLQPVPYTQEEISSFRFASLPRAVPRGDAIFTPPYVTITPFDPTIVTSPSNQLVSSYRALPYPYILDPRSSDTPNPYPQYPTLPPPFDPTQTPSPFEQLLHSERSSTIPRPASLGEHYTPPTYPTLPVFDPTQVESAWEQLLHSERSSIIPRPIPRGEFYPPPPYTSLPAFDPTLAESAWWQLLRSERSRITPKPIPTGHHVPYPVYPILPVTFDPTQVASAWEQLINSERLAVKRPSLDTRYIHPRTAQFGLPVYIIPSAYSFSELRRLPIKLPDSRYLYPRNIPFGVPMPPAVAPFVPDIGAFRPRPLIRLDPRYLPPRGSQFAWEETFPETWTSFSKSFCTASIRKPVYYPDIPLTPLYQALQPFNPTLTVPSCRQLIQSERARIIRDLAPRGEHFFLWSQLIPSGYPPLPTHISELVPPTILRIPPTDIPILVSPIYPTGYVALPTVEGVLPPSTINVFDTRFRTTPQDAFFSDPLQQITTWLPAFLHLAQSYRSLPQIQQYPGGTEIQDAWIFSGIPPFVPLDPTLWGGIEQLFRSFRSTGDPYLDVRQRTDPQDAFFSYLAEQVASKWGAINQSLLSFRTPKLPYETANPGEYPFDISLRTNPQDTFFAYVYEQIASQYPASSGLLNSFRSNDQPRLDTRYLTSPSDAYYQLVVSQISEWWSAIDALSQSYRSLPPDIKYPSGFSQDVGIFQFSFPIPLDPALWGSIEQLLHSFRSLPRRQPQPSGYSPDAWIAAILPFIPFIPMWWGGISTLPRSFRTTRPQYPPFTPSLYYVPVQLQPPPITPLPALKTFSYHREGWLRQSFTKSEGGDVENTERR